MTITTLFVDLGKVLVDFDTPTVIGRFARDFGLEPEEVGDALYGTLGRQFEEGTLTKREFFHLVLLELGIPIREEEFWEAFCCDLRVMEDSAQVIAEVQGVKIIAASNVDPVRFEHIRKTGAFHRFQMFGTSFALRARKPDRRFYERLAGFTSSPPGACLFIDDMPANVEVASAFGFQTLLFESSDSLRETLRAHGLLP